MPAGRPGSNIDRFRDEITHSYELGRTLNEILQSITAQGCKAQLRTLQRRIRVWGLERRVVFHEYTPEILGRIQEMFFVRGWTDDAIQQDLQSAGIDISTRTVQALRLRHGMKRRYVNDEDRIAALQAATQRLEQHHQKGTASAPELWPGTVTMPANNVDDAELRRVRDGAIELA